MPTYNEDLNVNGEANISGNSDATQLVVKGHTTQTNPLQQWQSSGAVPVARLTGDGRLQVGSFSAGEMATDDSLIEAHRAETDTTKPKRGFHLMGAITGVLSTAIAWVVQELTLKGSSGVSALHTALRVRLRNEATGIQGAGAELRGADIDVTHAGSGSGATLAQVVGLRVGVAHEGSATSTAMYGVKVDLTNPPSNAYALYTSGGKIRFGDLSAGDVTIDANGVLSTTPSNTSSGGSLPLLVSSLLSLNANSQYFSRRVRLTGSGKVKLTATTLLKGV